MLYLEHVFAAIVKSFKTAIFCRIVKAFYAEPAKFL